MELLYVVLITLAGGSPLVALTMFSQHMKHKAKQAFHFLTFGLWRAVEAPKS